MLQLLVQLFKSVWNIPGGQRVILVQGAKVMSAAVNEISDWIRTSSREEARMRVAKLEGESAEKLRKVFEEFKNEMSSVVREEFEKRIFSTSEKKSA